MKLTDEMKAEILRRFPDEPNEMIAADIGCSPVWVKQIAYRAGASKSEAFVAESNKRRGNRPRRRAGEAASGGRQIATGRVIVSGNVLTHLSRFAVRER